MQKPWSPSSEKEKELMYENFSSEGKAVKAIKKVAKQTRPNNEKMNVKNPRKKFSARIYSWGLNIGCLKTKSFRRECARSG